MHSNFCLFRHERYQDHEFREVGSSIVNVIYNLDQEHNRRAPIFEEDVTACPQKAFYTQDGKALTAFDDVKVEKHRHDSPPPRNAADDEYMSAYFASR